MAGVQLKSLRYRERVGHAKQWTLNGLELGHINLIVGRNATGKSRTLTVLWNLASSFVPTSSYRIFDGDFDLTFTTASGPLHYRFTVERGEVQSEVVKVGEDTKLTRHPKGGSIYHEELGRPIPFRPPASELAAVTRRDPDYHKFLEPLHEWAQAVRYYRFGTPLGKAHVAAPVNDAPEVDDRDSNLVVAIFAEAGRRLGPEFVNAVVADMNELHYKIDALELQRCDPRGSHFDGVPQQVLAIGVREHGVQDTILQLDISQGMFRALSILIQVNYSQMARRANCILIDDIGEGLDFERSAGLIDILRRKARTSAFQLVMTTNDRFVMNHVPLSEWSVLQREGGEVQVRNYQNSREHFDAFKFTGLNNFDFLRYDFLDEIPNAVSAEVGAARAD